MKRVAIAPLASCARPALTLLEVVLALAILAGSFVTLSQLAGLGLRAAGDGRDLTRAQLLAESVMSELSAGILPVQSLGQVPSATEPGWTVSATVRPTIHQGIVEVTIGVDKIGSSMRRSQFTLTQWLRDPSLAIPEDEEALEASSAAGATTSQSGTGFNGDAGGNPGGQNGLAPTPSGNGPQPNNGRGGR